MPAETTGLSDALEQTASLSDAAASNSLGRKLTASDRARFFQGALSKLRASGLVRWLRMLVPSRAGSAPKDESQITEWEECSDEENQQRRVAFYGGMVDAWVSTRMERDRTVVTLASGGVGLLVTILTTVGVAETWHLLFYALSASGFGVSIAAILRVLERNAKLVEYAVGRRANPPRLAHLDRLSRWAFMLGMLFFFVVAVLTALAKTHSLGRLAQ